MTKRPASLYDFEAFGATYLLINGLDDMLNTTYIIQAMIDARVEQNITQKELSARTGITQADISRIENGTRNPSLNMVKKLAQGLGMQLKLEFIPAPTKK